MNGKRSLKRVLTALNSLRYRTVRARLTLKRTRHVPGRDALFGTGVVHFSPLRSYGGAAQVALSIHREMLRRGRVSRYLFQSFGHEELGRDETRVSTSAGLYRWFAAMDGISGYQGMTVGNMSHPILRAAHGVGAGILQLHNLHGSALTPLSLPRLTRNLRVVWTLHDMQAITGHCAHSYGCDRWAERCGACPYLDVYPAMKIDRTSEMLKLKKRVYSLSDVIIVSPSMWLKRKIERSILKDHRTELIYNGIEADFFCPPSSVSEKDAIRRALGLPVTGTVVLSAAAGGSDNPWKGGQYIERFRQESGNDFVFVEIGGKREKRSPFNWSMGYVSAREDLKKLYQASDLLLYPSLADNCPLVVLEAQACGCPVAAFSTGGIPELVVNGSTGVLVNYRDYEALATGVKSLLREPERMSRMRQNARSLVEKRFTLKQMVDKYVALYDQLLC